MTAVTAASLPQTCYPAVWLWPGQVLYAGPALNLEPHSGSVWCLAVGVDGAVTVTADGHRVAARSVLIPPRLVHHLDTHGGRLVSCYLDPSSGRASACGDRCRSTTAALMSDHADEDALRQMPEDDESARRWLDLAAPASPAAPDPRIAETIRRIAADPCGGLSSGRLAAAIGLSESRFLHLFRHQAGTSLRRYRMWMRLLRAGEAVSAGKSLTDAAADAGFASPSHLSDRFKSTFGLTATDLLSSGAVLRVLPDIPRSPGG
ncbi:helix-turn-helix domain-containing protein [Mycobacterium sp. 4D054]|uniref:helix-turn-helix domain-containing protein n=1 Tax=unclassified Mycobacterium TaxID=2642494 RepID=UPI0021B1CF26|nr:AraC family transcriptional regulator [Mycobacterium sp. SMC-8]UXA09770.1 AraC family transcriptional regulator [Mycobacterium sp. SMC-8]